MQSRGLSKSGTLPQLKSPTSSTGINHRSLQDGVSDSGKVRFSRRSSRRKSKRSNSLKIPELRKTSPAALDRCSSDGAIRTGGSSRVPSSSSSSGLCQRQEFVVRERFWYVIQYGNNGNSVRQCMQKRPGWCMRNVKVIPDEAPCAHFLWTHFGQKAFLDTMAAHQRIGNLKARESPLASAFGLPSATKNCMMHNHLEGAEKLCTKHELCENLCALYEAQGRDPFLAMPFTVVSTGRSSFEDQAKWRSAFERIENETGEHMWILKPSSGSRGNGIVVCDNAEDISETLESADPESYWVVQKYLERPFLFHGRKFDLRSYCLVVQDPRCGTLRAYLYPDFFLKTCGALYSADSCDKFVHLTNGPVQRHGQNFGQFEDGNKLPGKVFQQYLDDNYKDRGFSLIDHILPQMKKLTADSVNAVAHVLNPRRISHCFQVFGFDWMIDTSFKLWLIEVNGNPCLEISSSFLEDVIPKMLDEAFRLTLDRLFPGATEGGCLATVEPTAWELVFCSSVAAVLT